MAQALPSIDDLLGPETAPAPAAPTMLRNSPYPAAATVVPASPAQKPSVDDLLGPEAPPNNWAARFDRAGQQSIQRITDAFGYGAKTGFGSEPIGVSPDLEAVLKKAGLFNDYAAGHANAFAAITEGLIRPAAAAMYTALRGSTALATGTLEAAGQAIEESGLVPKGSMTGDEGLAGAATDPGLMMVFPHVAEPPVLDLARARNLGVIGEGEAGWKGTVEPTPETVEQRAAAAREQVEAEKAQPAPTGAPVKSGAASSAAPSPVLQAAQQVPPDIHAVARQIDPATFQQYDALTTRQDTFRRWIDELGQARAENPKVAAANDEIETILGKVNGVEDRLTNRQAARVSDLRQQVTDFLSTDTKSMRQVREAAQKNDFAMRDLAPQVAAAYRQAQESIPQAAESGAALEAPAMAPAAKVGASIAEQTPPPAEPLNTGEPAAPTRQLPIVRFRAELAGIEASLPPVADGETRLWRGNRPGEEGKNPQFTNDAAGIALPFREAYGGKLTYVDVPNADLDAYLNKGVAAEGAEFILPPDVAAKARAVDTPPRGAPVNIAADVSQKLVSAGRPQEEADAAAALVEAHYEVRAARFGGAKGSASDLYSAEGPDIRGAASRVREKELAQPGHTLEQTKRGSITLKDAGATIKLFKDADASTFVHETGHQWLEELMRDAADERAPDGLKADAASVRKWLGVGDDEAVPTKAHEKFARGFERYLMEGRAPTRALARVFAQFKQWLTAIYQTVAKLRSPITDDIRDVFDRLIATNPEHAIIAPDREPGRNIHDLHEEEAEKTPPERAKPVADVIRVETNEVAKVRAPEVNDEFGNRKASGGAGGIPAENPRRPSGPNEAGPLAGETGGAARPGTLDAGGNKAPKEGPSARKEPLAPVYARVPKEPMRLVDFIKRNGGLKDEGGNVATFAAGSRGLIRKAGLDLDTMARKAWDAGYFPESQERPTPNDLLGKLEQDVRGNAQYSGHDSDAVGAYHNALSQNSEVDRLAAELGLDAKLFTPEQFWDRVGEKMSVEEMDREQLSKASAMEDEFREADTAAKAFMDERGDAWEPDALYGNVQTRTLEDLEREYQSEESARNQGQGAGRAEQPGSAAAGAGPVQEGGGPGGRGAGASGRGGQEVRDAETPSGPNAKLPESESRFVDKAGNIRLDNLNSTEDVNSTLRDYATANDGFLGARRGVVTEADIIDYADANGLNASDVNIDKLRAMSVEDGIPLAARIYGGRQMLVQSAAAVHAAMQGDDELNYAAVSGRHLRIQETLAGITAEWGRAGHAFRSFGEEASKAQELSEFLKDNTGKTLFQLKQEMAAGRRLDSPSKVTGFLNDARKSSLGEMVLEAFKNWLISGPQTHLMYAVGNKVFALYKALPETAARAAVGAIHEAIVGKPIERVRFGEIQAQLYGMFYGQRNGLRAAYDSFKAGQTAALPGEEATMLPGMTPTTQFTQTKAIPGVLGSIIRAPGERMVAPIHAYDRAVGYETNKAALIYRQASSEGLVGDDFNRRVADLAVHTPPEIMAAARDEATSSALMGRPGEFTRRFSSWIRWETELPLLGRTQPLSFIEPFVNIGSIINKQALIDRGPLGLASRAVLDDMRGKNGPLAQDAAIAKMALGTAVAGAAGGLVMEGLLNPSAPSDPSEAAISLRVNGLPHSIRIGDMSYQLNRLGVIGMQLSVAADMFSVAKTAANGDLEQGAGLLVHSVAQNFLDEGYASGIADLMRAIDDSDRYGESYVRNFFSTALVPFSVGMSQLAKSVDPYARQARTLADAMVAKIPFASESLYPRRDIWGEMVPNNQFRGVYAQGVLHDPVDQSLLAIGYYPGMPEQTIRSVRLTEGQYDDYARISGRMAKTMLRSIVQMPGFRTLPAEVQRDMMSRKISDSRRMAQDQVMMKYPAIIAQATKTKADRLRR